MPKIRSFYRLLFFCNLLFLAYYLILGYYNQPATDDYCVIAAQNTYGFNSPITYWYKFWNGRILPLYLTNIFLTIFQKTGTTIWFTIFLIVGYVFSIYRILKILIEKNIVTTNKNTFIILNIAAFIFNVFVYNNFKFNTFFWLNASTMYFGGILFFLIGFGEIIATKKSWFTIPLIIFSFVYAGFSTENHALVMALFMIGAIFLKLVFKIKLNYDLNFKFYLGAISILVSFIILILAPGSQHRISSDSVNITSSSQSTFLFQFGKNFIFKYLLLIGEILLMYLPFLLLLIPIIITALSDQINRINTFPKINKFTFLITTITTILLIGTAIAPTIYIFGNIGPQRILTIVNALLLVYFLIICQVFFINYYKNLNFKITINLAIVSIFLIILQVGYRIYSELPILKVYSTFEINKREAMHSQKNNQKEIEFPNFNGFNTPNITEKVVTNVLGEISPNSLKMWSKILKHEPILLNYIENTEVKIYEECFSVAFNKNVKIIK